MVAGGQTLEIVGSLNGEDWYTFERLFYTLLCSELFWKR